MNFRVKHGWISDGLHCNIMTILAVFDGHESKIMSCRIMSTWCSNRVSGWSCNTHKTCDRGFDEDESDVEHLPWSAQSPDLNIIEVSENVFLHQHHIVTWTLFWKRNGS